MSCGLLEAMKSVEGQDHRMVISGLGVFCRMAQGGDVLTWPGDLILRWKHKGQALTKRR